MLLVSIDMRGQASLPFAYDGGNPLTSVVGLTQSKLSAVDYASSPKMKFGSLGSYLILNFSGTPGVLSFKIAWIPGLNPPTSFSGVFDLLESPDGITYTSVHSYNSTTGILLVSGAVLTETFTTLLSNTRYLKWVYTTKPNGNIAIGNISLTAGSLLKVTPQTLSGFTYISGSGTSREQSFIVGGSQFIHDISISPSASYEISAGTGNLFQPTSSIVLPPLNGTVSDTAVYVRLKAGLAVNNYNENVQVTSVDASTQVVSCSGNVTPVPTLAVTDMTNLSLNTTVGHSNSQEINVGAVNLSSDLGLSLSGTDANQFSLSQYTLPQTNGSIPTTKVVVTYNPTVQGNHTATLLMSSTGAMDVTRTLNGVATVGTGLNSTQTMKITASNGNVIFSSDAGEVVKIYNSIGQKLVQQLTVDGVNKIPIATHGVVLVNVGGTTAKVIL